MEFQPNPIYGTLAEAKKARRKLQARHHATTIQKTSGGWRVVDRGLRTDNPVTLASLALSGVRTGTLYDGVVR